MAFRITAQLLSIGETQRWWDVSSWQEELKGEPCECGLSRHPRVCVNPHLEISRKWEHASHSEERSRASEKLKIPYTHWALRKFLSVGPFAQSGYRPGVCALYYRLGSQGSPWVSQGGSEGLSKGTAELVAWSSLLLPPSFCFQMFLHIGNMSNSLLRQDFHC